MKSLAALMMLLTVTAWSVATLSSECFAITDDDIRNACLAAAKGDPSYCFRIEDGSSHDACLAQVSGETYGCFKLEGDARAACLGRTERDVSRCRGIDDPDARNACLGEADADRSRCFRIANADARSRCLANTPR